MNVEELQSVRDSERRTDSLQQLRESFYADAGEFVQELRDRRDRAAERADDPFDAPEVDRLTSEINAAEETVEAIYEKRLGKLVKAASLAAADMPAGTEGMTAEEQQLFDTLVEDIKANRRHVLDVLAGEQDDPTRDDGVTGQSGDGRAEANGESTDEAVGAADVMGEPTDGPPGTDPVESTTEQTTADAGREHATGRNHGGAAGAENHGDSTTEVDERDSEAPEVDRERVRITTDVGAIFGVDEREYDLSENDVVTLPRENVEPLLAQDAAERL